MLPKVTILPPIPEDRIYGAGLPLFEHGDVFERLEADMALLIAQAQVNKLIDDHARRNRQQAKRYVPRWHHWRIWRLAINWRWCKA